MESQAKAAASPVTSCQERPAGGFAGQSRSLPCAFLLKLPGGMYRFCKQNTVHTQLAEFSGNRLALTRKGMKLKFPSCFAAGQLNHLVAKLLRCTKKGIEQNIPDCSAAGLLKNIKDLFLQCRLLGNRTALSQRFATGVRNRWNRRPRPQPPL